MRDFLLGIFSTISLFYVKSLLGDVLPFAKNSEDIVSLPPANNSTSIPQTVVEASSVNIAYNLVNGALVVVIVGGAMYFALSGNLAIQDFSDAVTNQEALSQALSRINDDLVLNTKGLIDKNRSLSIELEELREVSSALREACSVARRLRSDNDFPDNPGSSGVGIERI